jgi:kynurenine formamidase
MCAPGTIEAGRDRFEEDDSFVRIDRRKALLAGAGAAVAAAFPVMAKAAPGRAAAGRAQDLTYVFAESLPLFADIFPRPTRDTFVTIPNDGFYGQVWRFWEHTGTHLDVPAHFIAGGRTTPELTLDELMSPLAVVDISRRAASNPDTVVTVSDLRDYERGHGRIKRGSVVAMNSGWDARGGSEAAYRNADASGVSHFPGFSGEAVEWLIEEREIAGIGVDTLSLDPGNATQFSAHLTLLGANRFGMENLANLGRIPARGATAFIGVIPWEEGSGGPARVIATW